MLLVDISIAPPQWKRNFYIHLLFGGCCLFVDLVSMLSPCCAMVQAATLAS